MMAGVNMVHVPYRGGGPALTDLLGGQVQVMFAATVASIEYIRAGRLRALAVTTATRSDALPDIPTVGEFVPGYEASAWYGVGAPKNTPAEIVEKLNREINAGLADPKIKARLADLGGTRARRLARRLRQAHRRRNREVGQGDPGGQHQGGVGRPLAGTFHKTRYAHVPTRCRLWVMNRHSPAFQMSASLIGRLGSSAFRLSTSAVSMSLTGSRFSSESAPRPFHHGIRGRGGTIFATALPS